MRVNKYRRMRWVYDVARMGEETCVQGFIDKRKGKGIFGGSRRRWQYNMNKDLK